MHNLINAAHELCSANSFPFHSCLFVIDRLSLVVVTIITFMWGLRKGVSLIFILLHHPQKPTVFSVLFSISLDYLK